MLPVIYQLFHISHRPNISIWVGPVKALISLPLVGSSADHEHHTDILIPYKIDMGNMLANTCLYTHPDREQHWHSFEVVFLNTP